MGSASVLFDIARVSEPGFLHVAHSLVVFFVRSFPGVDFWYSKSSKHGKKDRNTIIDQFGTLNTINYREGVRKSNLS